MASTLKSYTLVIVQFAVLLVILLTGPWIASNPVLMTIELAAIVLGSWAILSMQVGNFNITPDVRTNARFVRKGPYGLIRHPMYTAVLLGALALILADLTWLRALLWILLLVDLVVKIEYEERLLATAFGEYNAYRSATKRLIPFIY